MAELRWGAATDPGRVRKANEDGVLAAPDVFAVADGMGGHAAGEVASAVALETVRSRLDPRVATMASVTDVVRAANEAVHRRSLEDPATRGMGTTLTLIAPASGPDGDRLPTSATAAPTCWRTVSCASSPGTTATSRRCLPRARSPPRRPDAIRTVTS
jgi:serine/threonine protein phosphatase PrpC